MSATQTFPIYRDGHPFTIREVHDGDLLGMVTLRGESGEVTVSADEVFRRLYVIRCSFPSNGLVTGSYGQTLTWTWTEAQEWIASVRKHKVNAGHQYTIEVAQ